MMQAKTHYEIVHFKTMFQGIKTEKLRLYRGCLNLCTKRHPIGWDTENQYCNIRITMD